MALSMKKSDMDLIYDESGGVIGAAGPITGPITAYATGANGPAGPLEKKVDYKYNEAMYIKEISDYINSTYGQHYSRNKFQATEFIMDSGHGTGFCMGNVMKYAQRYGRKGSRSDWRKDLLKVIHYAMMQLHVHDFIEDDKEKR